MHVLQVNQAGESVRNAASRNRVSRDSFWKLPRASLLSYPCAFGRAVTKRYARSIEASD